MPDYAHILNPGGRYREPGPVKAYSSMPARKVPMAKRANGTAKRRLAKLVYRDSFGVSFAESRLWLPKMAKDWSRERPMSDLKRPAVLQFAHQQRAGFSIARSAPRC